MLLWDSRAGHACIRVAAAVRSEPITGIMFKQLPPCGGNCSLWRRGLCGMALCEAPGLQVRGQGGASVGQQVRRPLWV